MVVDATGTYCVRNILYLRKKYCVSRRGLAKLIGMTQSILRDIEEGRFPPVFPYQRLKRLQDVFGIPMEEILQKDLSTQKRVR